MPLDTITMRPRSRMAGASMSVTRSAPTKFTDVVVSATVASNPFMESPALFTSTSSASPRAARRSARAATLASSPTSKASNATSSLSRRSFATASRPSASPRASRCQDHPQPRARPVADKVSSPSPRFAPVTSATRVMAPF